MDFNIFHILFGAGAVQGIILCFLILFKKEKRTNDNIFLAFILFIFSLTIVNIIGYDSNFFLHNLTFLFAPISLLLGFGPSIFLFAKFKTLSYNKFKLSYLFHFLPLLIEIIFYLFLTFQENSFKLDFFNKIFHYTIFPIEQFVSITSTLIYLVLSINEITSYQKQLLDNFSEISETTLVWLKRQISAYILIWVLWSIMSLIDFFIFDWDMDYVYYYPIYAILAVFTYWIGFSNYLKPKITLNLKEVPIKKQEVSSIDILNKEVLSIIYKLKKSMEDDKIYTEPTLTIKKLAEIVDVNPKLLSSILNSGLKKNFYDYVNEYRVEEAKRLLLLPENKKFTILSIAYDSGFNSKSTFNDTFKKFTEQTPSQFRKSN